MKKIRYIICVAMAAIMLLAAAGCQGGEAPAEPTNTAEPTAEAPAEQSEYNAKAEAAYKAAVEKLVNDKVFPNGEDTGFADDSSFGDMGENRYAIADVDSDGKDELIISFTTAPVAGEAEQVYGYNDADGTLKLKLNEFPQVTYYTNGIAEVGWSHNQGWAGDRLWPYSLFFYNADKDEYEMRYSVDAWDKALADKDADGNLYSEGSYASFHVTVAPGIAKPRVIKESKPAEKESENGKAAEAEGNKEPAKVEESKETVKPETTEPKKIYEDDRDDPDYVPFD